MTQDEGRTRIPSSFMLCKAMDAVSRLRQVSFLEHLTPEEFDALAEMMDLRPFIAGDRILTQGEPTTNFYIIDSGYVNLRQTDRGGFEKSVATRGEGEYFGVKMFTTQEPSEFTFEAVGRAHMWVVERQDWDALLEKFPFILEHMPELRAEYERLTRGLGWLAPGEVVEVLTRRHWWAIILMLRLPLLIAFIFTVAFAVSWYFGVVEQFPFVVIVYGIAMLFCLLWSIYRGIEWWNDTYIVTNKRVIRINKVLFLSDSREELPVEKIQSQVVSRGGAISAVLNISDLRVTSASNDSSGVFFEQVGNVAVLQKAISTQQARVVERKSAAERERARGMIANEIRNYILPPQVAPAKPGAVPAQTALPPAGGLSRKRAASTSPWGSWWASLYGTEMREGKTVTWRKHHFVLLRQIFWGLLVLGGAVGCLGFTIFGGLVNNFSGFGVSFALLAFSVPALVYVIWQWADWRVDLYKLSDSEITDIESLPLGLRYSENKAEISKIQDIRVERPRFINTLLDFGDVVARVAGSAEPFTFYDVGHPHRVADEITERIEVSKIRATERNTRDQTRQIVDALVAYHRLAVAERFIPDPNASNPAAANAPTNNPTALTNPAPPAAPALNPPPIEDKTPSASASNQDSTPPDGEAASQE